MNKSVLALLLSTVNACSDPTHYRLPNGLCTPCPATTQPDANQVTCVPVYYCHFASGQITTPQGCKSCDACSQPNVTNNGCVAKADQSDPACIALKAQQVTPSASGCDPNQFLATNGVCQSCPPCQLQDNTGFGCVKVPYPSYEQCMNTVCDWNTEVLDPTGGCQKCDDCYEPNSVKNLCVPVQNFDTCANPNKVDDPIVCNWLTEVRNPLGLCEPCGKCTSPDWQNKYCLPQADYATCMSPTPTWTAPTQTITVVQAPTPTVTVAPRPVVQTVVAAPQPTVTVAPRPVTQTVVAAPTYTTPSYTVAAPTVSRPVTTTVAAPTYSTPTYTTSAPRVMTTGQTYSTPSYTVAAPTYTTSAPMMTSGYTTSAPMMTSGYTTPSYMTSSSYLGGSRMMGGYLFAEEGEETAEGSD